MEVANPSGILYKCFLKWLLPKSSSHTRTEAGNCLVCSLVVLPAKAEEANRLVQGRVNRCGVADYVSFQPVIVSKCNHFAESHLGFQVHFCAVNMGECVDDSDEKR